MYPPQTETFRLPSEFWNGLIQILGLLTRSRIAALAFDQPGRYVADSLAPLIRVSRLAGSEPGRCLESSNPGRVAGQPG